MRILGFINAFDELAETDQRLGRKVANYGLVAALLEHSTCDELHFFLPFHGAVQPFSQGYAPWLERPGMKERVRLYPAATLPVLAERTGYMALHAGELDRYFPELCHLRNRHARKPFAVTCTTHTLSYWSTQVRNLYKVLPGPREYDSVFCTSRAARDHLSTAFEASAGVLREMGLASAGYAGRLDVIPLGVRADEFEGHDPAQARQSLGLKPDAFTILCLGRLSLQDKFDLRPLLGAAALLAKEADLALVLAGAAEASYVKSLTKIAAALGLADRLRIIADFDSKQKPALYAAADVFVSPSDNLQETFGLSILEAMAAGLPVVASDFSGYRDLVAEGETGFLIPMLGPNDYGPLDALWPITGERVAALNASQRSALDLDLLLASLRELAASSELRQRLGQAGRQRVRERFDWPVVVRQMESLWDELKARAKSQSGRPAPADAMGAGLGRVFSHFPSRAIQPKDVLSPGLLAGLHKQGLWTARPHPDLDPWLTAQGVEMLLASLDAMGGEASLGQLTDDLAPRLPAFQVEHLALYALKFGLLSRGPKT